MNIVSDVVYLDNAFVVEAYQKLHGKDAAVKYTKTTDVSLGLNAIAKAGASLKESFEYPISTHSMYKKIHDKLNEISTIEVDKNNCRKLPDIFWMDGLFGIMQFTSRVGKPNESINYVFGAASKEKSTELLLATNDVYFSSGYDQLIQNADSFADGFTIEAKMLLKFLGTSRNFSMASPMVVIKKGTFEF